MTLLQLIQQVCNELGISPPNAVVSSTNPQIRQLYALLNRHGHDLARAFEWQRLDKEWIVNTVAFDIPATFTLNSPVVTTPSTTGITTNFGLNSSNTTPFTTVISVDSPTQFTMNMPSTIAGLQTVTMSQVAYPLPSDWLKQIPQTEWDRTNRWPMLGPKSAQEWQSFKSGIVYAGPRERFRIQGGALQISPPPPNGLTFAYEYISSSWVGDVSGTTKPAFTADTDTTIFDDSLMIVGLKMRWLRAKGLDFSVEMQEFNNLLSTIKAQDKSAPKLSLSPVSGSIYLGTANIPDGNWSAS
ncbi:hypothetical protein J2W35_004953 [Variovorax boronicumulans]|uniref:hypothetical protein n=1 Tax=Variovorax boronicumulans TaxID=436515 RepID=UPI002787101C|nr:hypothetical protein [Variovorax boronicumulans]MDQ0084584.1 hypothetical protein [Variovorax boronicumulans]